MLAGGSYAGFMTLYSFLQSCIQQDTSFYHFIPSSPVVAGYYSMLDQLAANADSLGKNLILFIAEHDVPSYHSTYKMMSDWVHENGFSHFNFYSEVHLGRTHTTTSYDAIKIGIQILLNMPRPYFQFATNVYCNNDTSAKQMIRKWPTDGILSGNGVSDTCFIPFDAGAGVHTLTYTYTDEFDQTYTSEMEVTVNDCTIGIEEHNLPGLLISPNPAIHTATISFTLDESHPVSLSLFNLLGQEKLVLLNEMCYPGAHEIQIDVSGLQSGLYLVRLVSDEIYSQNLLIQ